MKRRYPLVRRGTSAFGTTFLSYIPPQPADAVTLAVYGTGTSAGTYHAALATSFSPDTGELADLAGFASIDKNFDASQCFAATGTTSTDTAARAALAARWNFSDGGTSYPHVMTALNVDMLVERDEPQPGVVSGVTDVTAIKWPNFVVGSDVFTSQIPLNRAWQFGSSAYPPSTILESGSSAPSEQITPPRLGYTQLAVSAITNSSVDGVVIGTANPDDLMVIQVMALVASQGNQDLKPNGDPKSVPFLSWAWVPTTSYVLIPGGWTQVGNGWNPGGSNALFPGDTAFLGHAQIGQDPAPLESAITPLPAAAVGVGVRSWCHSNYSAQVPVTVKCQVRMW